MRCGIVERVLCFCVLSGDRLVRKRSMQCSSCRCRLSPCARCSLYYQSPSFLKVPVIQDIPLHLRVTSLHEMAEPRDDTLTISGFASVVFIENRKTKQTKWRYLRSRIKHAASSKSWKLWYVQRWNVGQIAEKSKGTNEILSAITTHTTGSVPPFLKWMRKYKWKFSVYLKAN